MAKEKPLWIAVIVFTFLLLVVTLLFNFLSAVIDGLFRSTVGDVSNKYNLDITPASWTFTIWAFIYIAQVLFMIYAFTLICRKNNYNGGKLYYDPPFMPPSFFLIYCASLGLNIAWLFIFDRELLVAAFVGLFGIYFANVVCLVFSFKYLWQYAVCLTKAEMWVNIILVQNGIGLYATWTGVAAVGLNFGIVLYYTLGLSMEATCFISLSLLFVQFLIYFVIDVFIATTRLRYFFSVYIVLIVALSGVVSKNFDAESSTALYTVVLLVVVCLLTVVKVLAVVYYNRSKPLGIEMQE